MEDTGLFPITVYVLDGKGGILSEEKPASQTDSPVWIHFDYSIPKAQQWLTEQSGLESIICQAFLANEIRPRTLFTHKGFLMTLRAINSSPGSDPEDMVSLRIWIEEKRIVTSCRRSVPAIQEVASDLRKGDGPSSSVDLLINLIDYILTHVYEIVSELDVHIDQLEEHLEQKIRSQSHLLRLRLATLRRRIITLYRHLSPQREALSRTHMIELPWLLSIHKLHLLELADRTIYYLEDLGEARDRATIIQETISNIISEYTGYRMYILSMVAFIFLPLTLVAGMLGMNVDIPGAQSKWTFLCIVALMVLIGFIEYWIFRKKRWV